VATCGVRVSARVGRQGKGGGEVSGVREELFTGMGERIFVFVCGFFIS